MAVKSMTSQTDGGWQPSVKFLLVLLIVEVVLFGVMRSITQHGG